jgi:Tetratricopeptide repeat
MYCPECGSDAGDAKFCPECGTDLSGVRAARGGKGAGNGGKAAANGAKAAAKPGTLGPQARQEQRRGPSAAVLWIGIAVIAVVVVALVVMLSGGDNNGTTSTDTSGSYSDLVARANDLYDQGDTAFQSDDIEGGSKLFAQAAQLYAAAWKKQPGDPNVGTDYATALFYSGDIQGAVKQIEVVLKANPEFQTAWFNKGNYLAHEARITEQMGDAKAAKKLYAQARQAYLKAVALDPKSEVGKEADARLLDLPK